MCTRQMVAARACLAILLGAAVLLCGQGWASPAWHSRVIGAPAVAAPPVIDGDLSDPVWQGAGRAGGFIIADSGEPASEPTLVYALSDLDHLYLAFRCSEPNPGSLRAQAARDNSAVWGDDCIEFNFDPAGGMSQICQLKLNSIGTKEFLLRDYGRLDASAIRAAARVGAREYAIEVALPFSALGIARAPQVGMIWRVNFERLRTVANDEGDTWMPFGNDWANPDLYGELIIPGGPLVVEALGHQPLSVGRPSGAFLQARNRSRAARELQLTVADLAMRRNPSSQEVPLAGRQTARVPVELPVARSGERTYRFSLSDRSNGALLYSLERVSNVAKAVNVSVVYHNRQLLVDVDTRPWGDLAPDAIVDVELAPVGGGRASHTARACVLPEQKLAAASLDVGELPAGEYDVRAVAQDRSGKSLGPVLVESVAWPDASRWLARPQAATAAPTSRSLAAGASDGLRVLNNFVSELLKLGPTAKGEQRYEFTNPREGWVFIASEADVPASGAVRILLDGGPGEAPKPCGPGWRPDKSGLAIIANEPGPAGPVEAMRLLPAGKHELTVRCDGGARLQSLVVRAIPELLYCQFQADPHVSEHGPYDWDFLQRYVLPHCTTVIGSPAEQYRPYVEEWKRQGRHWIIACGVPGLSRDATVTADEAEKYWGEHMAFHDSLADGVIADEFGGGDNEKYLAWTEALRRLQRDPRLAGKTFYPYCGGDMHEADLSREFIQTVMDAGWRFAWESYLPEQPTEAQARAFLSARLSTVMQEWNAAQPGAARHTIVTLGYLSAPPESLDINPGVDYKVWMDMQFNTLANDPAFAGLYGVMEYLSSYADEENVRWAARLYRHYCIEGHTAPLLSDPYLLPHLDNPDCAGGADLKSALPGWEVAPAEPGSVGAVTATSMEGYSWLQGRYPETEQGDSFMLMKRSARGPNAASQTIKGLRPGRLYSLRMFTADYGDLPQQQKHAVSIRLDGVEVLEERSFQHVFHNCYSHHLGPYDDKHYAWMNYHWRIFRATGAEGRLTICDWATPDDPGGPVGQELMFNFVEVQPYVGESGNVVDGRRGREPMSGN